MPDSSSPAGDAESSSGLILAIRKFFDPDHGERSLRAQLEDAIDEHEDENGEDTPEHSGTGDLSLVERQMLRNLLHFSEHDADDVAVPRGQIIAIEATASWDQLVETFAEHGHSRMPVYREQLDDVIGMIHIKDVFTILARGEIIAIDAKASWDDLVDTFAEHGHSRMPVYRDQLDDVIGMIHIKDVFPILARREQPPRDWTVLMRQPLYVPQTRNALDVLADMRAQRMHLAIVVDEFSGTDGLITIEDLVEEIVGDIEDEHDDAPEEWIVDIGEGMWDCDARAELDDVAENVSPALAEVEESVDTLGGLAFVLAEQVPEVGRILEHPSGWRIEVTDGDETHVKRLRLHAPEPDATTV